MQPEFDFNLVSGLLFLVPLLLVRMGLMALLDRDAIARGSHFAPMEGQERIALPIYTVTTLALYIYPFFLSVKTGTVWLAVGLPVWLVGLVLCALTVIDFTRPNPDGRLERGVYRFSRHPMYISYFLCYIGFGLMTASWLYLLLAAVCQAATHWIMVAEERWCLAQFGDDYRAYMGRVRRYAGRWGS